MTLKAPTYDLVLLLDPQAEEGARAKVLADTRATIERDGELLRHDEWGERPLAYPIARRTSAFYHLFQFHAGEVQLLSDLERTLRITDEVLRFRVIKLKPGVPDAPDMRSSAAQAPPRRADGQPPEGQPLQAQAPEAQAPQAHAQGAEEEPAAQPA